MSTLPVRSPLPNSVPSTRSAPAITASSAAATAVPRSLCGCTLKMIAVAMRDVPREPFDLVGINVGRRHLDGGRQIQDGLALRRRLPDGIDGIADLHGEIEFGAGEALRAVLEDSSRYRGCASACSRTAVAPRTAMSMMPARSVRNTTRRWATEVEL